MSNIWFSSDLHFNHNKEFIYKERGFSSMEEMNESIIARFNSLVKPDDELYLLGDLAMGDIDLAKDYIKALNGHLHIILGNHDSARRIEFYKELTNDITYANMLKKKKRFFYLSHYPTETANLESDPHAAVINLFGHTHQKTNFYEDKPYIYHVGVDSHNCYPVALEQICDDFENKVKECYSCL